MYCAGVLTFDGGFMDSSFSRTKCITERLKTSRQGCVGALAFPASILLFNSAC
jgi:hypothetical protein